MSKVKRFKQESAHNQTNTRTDGRYQTYYLPCFAVDNYSEQKQYSGEPARKGLCPTAPSSWPVVARSRKKLLETDVQTEKQTKSNSIFPFLNFVEALDKNYFKHELKKNPFNSLLGLHLSPCMSH